ncbi:MAG TPA: hypothetical protein VIE67_05160 [Rudaea sp.]|jgi:hypothetical protein|uniref:hypothetical protein n=1 Tax=Rudaea sp. TaxID=2136325 RepID=UPI002F9540E9
MSSRLRSDRNLLLGLCRTLRRRARLALGAILMLCASALHAQDAPSYAIEFDATTLTAAVELCLAQAHARVAFAADSTWAMGFVHDLRRGEGRAVDAGSGEWTARDWQAGECLRYRADLGALADTRKPDVGWRLGDDMAVAPQLWLLRPDVQGDADAQLRIALPAAWSISAPWRELSRGGNSATGKNIRFSIPNTPADWSATVAIGHFDEEKIALPGGVLRLTILHGADENQREKLRAWFDRVAHAVLGAYGRLPLPDVQVLMIPVGARDQAVMFGQSVRGEGNALQLLIDPSRPAAEFADDWKAVHELSHLMHPYLGDRGSWLAEGLATYYQDVLRARGGLLTPTQAWDRLAEGFRLGMAQSADGSLEETADGMHRSHSFARVYWAGAAFWLTLDRDLRRASAGKQGVDSVLAKFRDCCLPAYREWRPETFVARLDALAGTRIFEQRYREFAAMREFPDWQGVYADLGIRDQGGHLRFDDGAKDAAIRAAIMATPRH